MRNKSKHKFNLTIDDHTKENIKKLQDISALNMSAWFRLKVQEEYDRLSAIGVNNAG